jgi:hypothetical protein
MDSVDTDSLIQAAARFSTYNVSRISLPSSVITSLRFDLSRSDPPRDISHRSSIGMHRNCFRRRLRCRAIRTAPADRAAWSIAELLNMPLIAHHPRSYSCMRSVLALPISAGVSPMSQRVAIGLRQRIRQKPLGFPRMSQKSQMSQPQLVRGKRQPRRVNEAHCQHRLLLEDPDPRLADACRNTKDRPGHPSRHIQRSPKLHM